MVGDLDRRINELRFLEGIEKVEHVPYPAGDEFWVRFTGPIDMGKLKGVLAKDGYELVKFGGLPSKLPRKLGEILWNGVAYVIVKNINFGGLFSSFLGFEPDSVAKIASDLHGSNPIFITTTEEGIKVLYEYLGLKYTPPPPPPVAPPKPTPVPAAKPVTPPPRPVTAGTPTAPPAKPTPIPMPATKPVQTTEPAPKPVGQAPISSEPKPSSAQPTQNPGDAAPSSGAQPGTKPAAKKEKSPT